MFSLHPQLARDSVVLGRFLLSQLLLMNDANYPWFILVPERKNIREIFELEVPDQQQLLSESSFLARGMKEYFPTDKINIAALGNVVPQLHVHHIARTTTDSAWPAPIWGKVPAKPYTEAAILALKMDFAAPLITKWLHQPSGG